MSYARQRRFSESITTLERAIRLEPKKGLYRNNVAMVLVETGDTDAALSHLKAVQGEAIAHYNVGYILQKKGDSEAAAQHFALAAQQDPSLAEAGAWLAKLQAVQPQTAQPPPKMARAPRSGVPRSPLPHTAAPLPPSVKPPAIVPGGPDLRPAASGRREASARAPAPSRCRSHRKRPGVRPCRRPLALANGSNWASR